MELWGFRKRQSRRTGCAVRTRFRGQIERAALWAARFVLISWSLQQLHVFCLPAFGAFDDVELHGLAFFQAAKAVALNCREVHEDVFAVLPADKAITLRVIEPLNCSLFHCVTRIPCFIEICAFLELVQAGCRKVQDCFTNAWKLASSLYPPCPELSLRKFPQARGLPALLCYFYESGK